MADEPRDPNLPDKKMFPASDDTDAAKAADRMLQSPSPDHLLPARSSASSRKGLHLPANRRPLYIGLAIFAVIFVLVLLAGGLPKLLNHRELDRSAQQQKNAKPVVEVIRIERAKATAGLALPGTTIPLNQAYIYARSNGYLKTLKTDIGDRVRKGQLLAVIDAPDLDAQVDQAREQVHQAQQQLEQQKAQLILATVTVQRYRVLVTKGVFSRQQGDQEEATYSSQLANVAAAERNVEAYQANLDRVKTLQGYEEVRAPFDGVITQRNADIGALITAGGSTSGPMQGPAPQGQSSSAGGTTQAAQTNSAGSSGGTNDAATSMQSPGQGGPLFGIAQNYRLRVLVSVPEGYASFIHPNQHAQLAFQEYAGHPVDGIVTRTAASIDQNTRTMLTELQVDNHDGKLIPGMYVVTTFPSAPGMEAPLVVTGGAVALRHDQSMLAIVNNGRIHMQPVTLGRDFGDVIEILAGVEAGDLVVTDITDDVVEGAQVQTHLTPSPQDNPQSPPSQTAPPGGSTRYSSEALTDQNLQGQQQNQNQQSQGQGKGETQKNGQSESKP
jgi:multidrug efflux pump subunit AcrA (membrane-fusion protein)